MWNDTTTYRSGYHSSRRLLAGEGLLELKRPGQWPVETESEQHNSAHGSLFMSLILLLLSAATSTGTVSLSAVFLT